ncbi:hypothetical protein TrVE_jg2449 [Triparma verrucosa]|uniref:Major facilitator superfamily (MFS) profile domain-containing protein n=1 Tax=Triparma verrucosa TaxID=1606542 RepID=A0A9W7C242_9STRA|nr:hypothetical protein TrVE_jg2449 [Triparma verrucosa]
MLTPLFLSFIFFLLLFPLTSSLPQSSRICIKSGPLKSNPPELPTSDHNRAYDRDDNDIDDNINIKIIQTCRGGHATDIINSGKLKGGDIEHNSILVQSRLTFLFFYISIGSLFPYLPVYYHSLNLPGSWIGYLGSVNPITTFLISPLWGAYSDRHGNHKKILLLTFSSSVVTRLMMLLSVNPVYLAANVFVTAALNAPVKPLLDNSVMAMLRDKGSYGKMRLYGQLGFGLGSSIVGILIAKSSLGYRLPFLIHGLVSIPTFFILKNFKVPSLPSSPSSVEGRNPEGPKFKEGLTLLTKNVDALVFFFLVFAVGVSSGCIENFAYVRMREVGGTGKDMGISRFVSASAGVPMFWFSGRLTRNLGVQKVLIGTLASYAVRFTIYSRMKVPLGGLPAEFLRGATFALFWSTATIYTHKISPKGMSATLLTFMNAMYGGLGQSIGAIIGGKVQERVGTVRLFRYGATFDAAFVIVSATYFAVRSLTKSKDTPKVMKIEESDED